MWREMSRAVSVRSDGPYVKGGGSMWVCKIGDGRCISAAEVAGRPHEHLTYAECRKTRHLFKTRQAAMDWLDAHYPSS